MEKANNKLTRFESRSSIWKKDVICRELKLVDYMWSVSYFLFTLSIAASAYWFCGHRVVNETLARRADERSSIPSSSIRLTNSSFTRWRCSLIRCRPWWPLCMAAAQLRNPSLAVNGLGASLSSSVLKRRYIYRNEWINELRSTRKIIWVNPFILY